MKELLEELKALIKACKNDEAVEKIDEALAAMPEPASDPDKEYPPLPGQGNNGHVQK